MVNYKENFVKQFDMETAFSHFSRLVWIWPTSPWLHIRTTTIIKEPLRNTFFPECSANHLSSSSSQLLLLLLLCAVQHVALMWSEYPSTFNIPHTLTIFFHLMISVYILRTRAEGGRKTFQMGSSAHPFRSHSAARAYELDEDQSIQAKLLNTMKIFLSVSPPCISDGAGRELRGSGGVVDCIWSDWTFTRISPHIFHP